MGGMSMDAKELMIKDCVSVLGIPMRIAEHGTVRAGLLDKKGEMAYNSYAIIEPIPLTHEVLVKNGLRECFDGATIEYEYFPEDKNGLLEITEQDGGIWWTINIAEYNITKLEYVHQLQHAIRLLGIDKEIIL